MKAKSFVVILFATIASTVSFAKGVEGGGGGDVCQDRIETIRNDISEWIKNGNSSQLDFSKSGTDLADYNAKMQKVISQTRANDETSIWCTDDPTRVQVDGAQKTCVSYSDPTQPRILCYRGELKNGQFVSGFMGLSQSKQYFQVHHEFAVLAGIEDQPKDDSDYVLSDQISNYLNQTVVKRLGVKAIGPCSPRVMEDAPEGYSCRTSNGVVWQVKGKYHFEHDSRVYTDTKANLRVTVVGMSFYGDYSECDYKDDQGHWYRAPSGYPVESEGVKDTPYRDSDMVVLDHDGIRQVVPGLNETFVWTSSTDVNYHLAPYVYDGTTGYIHLTSKTEEKGADICVSDGTITNGEN